MMVQILTFLSIVSVSFLLAILGTVKDTYHTPATGALLSALRALSIIILAGLFIFWGWEKDVIIPQSVTSLVLVDETTEDKPALNRSVSTLLKMIHDQGGRPVSLTYNSQDQSFMTDASSWQRFSRLEEAIVALKWIRDIHGPLPVAIISDYQPETLLKELGGLWDITWIDPEGAFRENLIQKTVYPEEVFVDQLFQMSVTIVPDSEPLRLVLTLNGEFVENVPIEPVKSTPTSVDVDLVLHRPGNSSLELTLYDGNKKIVGLEHLPVMALPKPKVIYISPFGKAAPLSRILAENSFDLINVTPGEALLDAESLKLDTGGHPNLIILDSIPLSYLKTDLTARLTDSVRRQGATMLYIPGVDIRGDFRGNSLERLLPVTLGYPDNSTEGESLAFVAIVDTSMSMFYTNKGSAGHGSFGPTPSGPVTKIQMAKKALENLSFAIDEENRFGILTVTDRPSWIMRPTENRDPASEGRLISQISAMGPGINLYSGLLAAFNELITIDSRLKHILIFLDTADVDEFQVSDRGTVWELLEEFRDEEITISLVGFGKPDDTHVPQLNRMAEESGGYFYLTSELEEIPGFGLKDLNQIADNLVTFQRKKVDYFPRDFTGVQSLPGLKGQVIFTLKPGASLYAWTDTELPLYAAWPYGKGSVGIFGADSGQYLAREWVTGTNRDAWLPLLSKLMMPDTGQPELFYSKDPDGDHQVYLNADKNQNNGAFSAQALLSNRSLLVNDMEKFGYGKYISSIRHPGTTINSVTVTDPGNSSFGIKVLPLPVRTQSARRLPGENFVPHPLKQKSHPETGPEPEILDLLILLALIFFTIDELFRPPSMEEGE